MQRNNNAHGDALKYLSELICYRRFNKAELNDSEGMNCVITGGNTKIFYWTLKENFIKHLKTLKELEKRETFPHTSTVRIIKHGSVLCSRYVWGVWHSSKIQGKRMCTIHTRLQYTRKPLLLVPSSQSSPTSASLSTYSVSFFNLDYI